MNIELVLHILEKNIRNVYSFFRMMEDNVEGDDIYIFFISESEVIKKYPRLLACDNRIICTLDRKIISKYVKDAELIIWHSILKLPKWCLNYCDKKDVMKKSIWRLSINEIEILQEGFYLGEDTRGNYFRKWMDSDVMLAIPSILFKTYIRKYTSKGIYELPYPVMFDNGVEAYINISKHNSHKCLYQIGIPGMQYNNIYKILELVKSNPLSDKYVLPINYADYVIKNVELSRIKNVIDSLGAINIIPLYGLVKTDLYLNYLSNIKELYIVDIPARALNSVLIMAYGGTNIVKCDDSFEKIDMKNYAENMFSKSFCNKRWLEIINSLVLK